MNNWKEILMDKPGQFETKYVFNNFTTAKVISWLSSRCGQDPGFPCGIVSSTYFDTRNWKYLNEKVNSDYLKTKVRLRRYYCLDGNKQGDKSFLEIKFRTGSKRKKIRIERDYDWLLNTPLESLDFMSVSDALIKEGIFLRDMIFPVFQIQYKRRRFIDPVTGMRLSVDYDIHVPRINRMMVKKTNPFTLDHSVFEVKGNDFVLPDNLQQLTAFGCRKQSFSKFYACYNNLMQNGLN